MQILIHHMHASDTDEIAKASEALQEGKVDEIVIADDETHSHAADTLRKNQAKKNSSWSLPEGVEGVFEPSVAGTRLQGGQSVCALFWLARIALTAVAVPESCSSIDCRSTIGEVYGTSSS
jgi:hypothetical protein